MRILVLSWYFPPISEIGALRVGKIADYLHAQGHDIWVISAERRSEDCSLTFALPRDRVIRTRWIDIDRMSSPRNWFGGSSAPPDTQEWHGGSSTWRNVAQNYMWLIRIPDQQGGWIPYLSTAAKELMKANRFDLIYASGPPFTCLVAAARLSRHFGVPWVAEYRDSWSKNHYVPKPGWRNRIDGFVENRVTRSATAIVAVTDLWADYYRGIYAKTTVAISNGFDGTSVSHKQALGSAAPPVLIVHTGTTYGMQRDPTVLFEGIKRAGVIPAELQVNFYGEQPNLLLRTAAAAGVAPFVKVLPRVPYNEALDIQRASDILLLLQSRHDWADIPAKMYEYFEAHRPILGLGCDGGIPARLIRERNAGLYDTNADAVAARLTEWVDEKRQTGRIAPLPQSTSDGLSRMDQCKRLEAFLETIVRSP
jgi:glycosyltransferase involved in cell wall biosynthesis